MKGALSRRMSVYRACPLHTLKRWSQICNPKLYLNPADGRVDKEEADIRTDADAYWGLRLPEDNSECPVGQ